jgi:predicted  nucleic acid-binding Zn-ribbon protein
MTDAQKIQRLERELQNVKSELAHLKDSVQDAVDDLQNSVQLIFAHVHVPNVVYKPGRRIRIRI